MISDVLLMEQVTMDTVYKQNNTQTGKRCNNGRE